MIRRYSELKQLKTFMDRYKYLQLVGIVGESTFGFDRYLNQYFYKSNRRWLATRDKVIIRDAACDLGLEGYEVEGRILIHHMNPITVKDIETNHEKLYNLEGLISTSLNTHNAIHFGDETLLPLLPKERFRGDTILW